MFDGLDGVDDFISLVAFEDVISLVALDNYISLVALFDTSRSLVALDDFIPSRNVSPTDCLSTGSNESFLNATLTACFSPMQERDSHSCSIPRWNYVPCSSCWKSEWVATVRADSFHYVTVDTLTLTRGRHGETDRLLLDDEKGKMGAVRKALNRVSRKTYVRRRSQPLHSGIKEPMFLGLIRSFFRIAAKKAASGSVLFCSFRIPKSSY